MLYLNIRRGKLVEYSAVVCSKTLNKNPLFLSVQVIHDLGSYRFLSL